MTNLLYGVCGVDAGIAAQTAWQTPAQYNVTGAATAPAAAARIGGVTCVLLAACVN